MLPSFFVPDKNATPLHPAMFDDKFADVAFQLIWAAYYMENTNNFSLDKSIRFISDLSYINDEHVDEYVVGPIKLTYKSTIRIMLSSDFKPSKLTINSLSIIDIIMKIDPGSYATKDDRGNLVKLYDAKFLQNRGSVGFLVRPFFVKSQPNYLQIVSGVPKTLEYKEIGSSDLAHLWEGNIEELIANLAKISYDANDKEQELDDKFGPLINFFAQLSVNVPNYFQGMQKVSFETTSILSTSVNKTSKAVYYLNTYRVVATFYIQELSFWLFAARLRKFFGQLYAKLNIATTVDLEDTNTVPGDSDEDKFAWLKSYVTNAPLLPEDSDESEVDLDVLDFADFRKEFLDVNIPLDEEKLKSFLHRKDILESDLRNQVARAILGREFPKAKELIARGRKLGANFDAEEDLLKTADFIKDLVNPDAALDVNLFNKYDQNDMRIALKDAIKKYLDAKELGKAEILVQRGLQVSQTAFASDEDRLRLLQLENVQNDPARFAKLYQAIARKTADMEALRQNVADKALVDSVAQLKDPKSKIDPDSAKELLIALTRYDAAKDQLSKLAKEDLDAIVVQRLTNFGITNFTGKSSTAEEESIKKQNEAAAPTVDDLKVVFNELYNDVWMKDGPNATATFQKALRLVKDVATKLLTGYTDASGNGLKMYAEKDSRIGRLKDAVVLMKLLSNPDEDQHDICLETLTETEAQFAAKKAVYEREFRSALQIINKGAIVMDLSNIRDRIIGLIPLDVKQTIAAKECEEKMSIFAELAYEAYQIITTNLPLLQEIQNFISTTEDILIEAPVKMTLLSGMTLQELKGLGRVPISSIRSAIKTGNIYYPNAVAGNDALEEFMLEEGNLYVIPKPANTRVYIGQILSATFAIHSVFLHVASLFEKKKAVTAEKWDAWVDVVKSYDRTKYNKMFEEMQHDDIARRLEQIEYMSSYYNSRTSEFDKERVEKDLLLPISQKYFNLPRRSVELEQMFSHLGLNSSNARASIPPEYLKRYYHTASVAAEALNQFENRGYFDPILSDRCYSEWSFSLKPPSSSSSVFNI